MIPTLWRAALLGASTGMRSMTAPALLSRDLAGRRARQDAGFAETLLARPVTVTMTSLAMVGELVADKLPGVPSRLEPGPLLARLAIGALSGCIVSRGSRADLSGAIAGALGALGGALALFHARRSLTRDAGLPDLPIAILEDILAHGTARLALRP